MAIRIKPGSSISSANVRQTNNYVDGRDIDNLLKVGAISEEEAELLLRVDGVISSPTKNRRPEVDELLSYETPDYRDTLLPEEQQLQPGLWRHLEWETAATVTAPVLAPLASQVADTSRAPGTVNRERPEAISSLDPALQKSARRVQLVLNHDGDPSTIALVDLDQAIARPQRFTPSDLQDFEAIVQELLRRQPSQPEATLDVPPPGVCAFPFKAGKLELSLQQVTVVTERRNFRDRRAWSVHLEARRDTSLQLTVPTGTQVIMINVDDASERVLGAGAHDLGALHGNFRVELWQGGARIEVADVAVPLHDAESMVLSQYADHELRVNGNALTKRLVSITDDGNGISATYSYDPAATPVTDSFLIARAGFTDSPSCQLEAGRYAVTFANGAPLTLDVYPQCAVKAMFRNVGCTLLPAHSPYDRNKVYRTQVNPIITFDPMSSRVMVQDTGITEQAQLTPNHRVG